MNTLSQATINTLLYNNEPAYQSPAYRKCCAALEWRKIEVARQLRPQYIKLLSAVEITDPDDQILKAETTIRWYNNLRGFDQKHPVCRKKYNDARLILKAARYQRRQMFKLSQLMAAE